VAVVQFPETALKIQDEYVDVSKWKEQARSGSATSWFVR